MVPLSTKVSPAITTKWPLPVTFATLVSAPPSYSVPLLVTV